MTIDEAIKNLSSDNPVLTSEEGPAFDEAVRLGIEALKVIKWDRTHKYPSNALLLPGETKD